MARLTKLELEQIINERNAQLLAARTQVSLLTHKVEVLERAAAVVTTTKAHLAAVTQPTSNYRQACARAREYAVSHGVSTLVGNAS